MGAFVTPRSHPRVGGRRAAVVAVGLALVCAAGMVLAAASGVDPLPFAALTAAGLIAVAVHSWLLRWPTLVGAIVAVILFVPMRRYELPGSLPINLEPYRLVVGVVAACWLASLLIQREVRLRYTGFRGPLAAFGAAIILGELVNLHRISSLGVSDVVIKKITFFLSFALVMALVASVCHRRRDIDGLVRLLVGGSAVVAGSALVESRTGFNVFNHLHTAIPVLKFDWTQVPAWTGDRGGRPRAYASAQHSISLGAALVMIVPLAHYYARKTGQHRWWAALALIALGAFATVSRTAMLMLVAEAIVLLKLKPASMKRLWPLVIPLLVAVHVAIPGTLGAFKDAFMPEGGLIAQQQQGAGTYGSGRIADLGPGLAEWSKTPVLGQGFGTRIVTREDPRVNAPILDDEWLGTLLETGAAGVLALFWLFVRAVRRLSHRTREDDSPRSWLTAGLAASVTAFAVGMFTYDAFAFIQVTFLLFILLGIAAAELLQKPYPRAL